MLMMNMHIKIFINAAFDIVRTAPIKILDIKTILKIEFNLLLKKIMNVAVEKQTPYELTDPIIEEYPIMPYLVKFSSFKP